MPSHSVAVAKHQLSSLIDLALEGEEVVITRDGRPVVTLKAVVRKARPMTQADADWLREQRVGVAAKEDAGAYVLGIRDEDWR